MEQLRRIPHPAEAWPMCGNTWAGYLRISKNDVSSSSSDISSFHPCCRNYELLISIKLWDVSILDKYLCLQNDLPSRDLDQQHQETLTAIVSPLTIWKSYLSLPWTILWTTPLTNSKIMITWASHRLYFGQPLWFDAALVNKLVPCAWLSSGALEIWRLRLRLRLFVEVHGSKPPRNALLLHCYCRCCYYERFLLVMFY